MLFVMFLPAAKPSGPRTVRVVIIVEGGPFALTKSAKKLWLHEFASGWDPSLCIHSASLGFINSLWGGIHTNQPSLLHF